MINTYKVTIKDNSSPDFIAPYLGREYDGETHADTIEEAITLTKEEYAEALNTFPESIEIISIIKFK